MVKFQHYSGGRTRSDRIRELLAANHEVFQMNINPKNQEKLPSDVAGKETGLSVPFLPSRSHVFDICLKFFSAAIAPLACSDFDPDLVYVYNSWQHLPFAGWLLSRYYSVPLVIGVNDHRFKEGLVDGFVHGWLRDTILKSADAVILESGTLESNLPTGLDPSRVIVVPTGVDTDEYDDLEASASTDPMVFYVGRSDDIELLFEAASIIKNEVPGVEIKLAGVEATEYPDVDTDLINFLGYVDDERLKGLLSRAQVCVVPYRKEKTAGRPIKLIEYMAAGNCIVATDHPYNNQLLVDGENGIISDSTPAAFARGIIEGLTQTETRRKLGKQARCDIRELSVKRMQEKLEKALEIAMGS